MSKLKNNAFNELIFNLNPFRVLLFLKHRRSFEIKITQQ